MKPITTSLSAACLTATLVLAGCTTVHDARVSAINNPNIKAGHSYRVVAANPSLQDGSPAYAETVGMVRNALSAKGMYEAENPEEAEVVVSVDYGVGPRRELVYTPPKIESRVAPLPSDPILRPRHKGRSRDLEDSSPILFDTLSEEENRDVVRVVYEKYLTIVARTDDPNGEAEGTPSQVEAWRVDVRIEDESTEIEPLLPVLVAAVVDRIGSDTGTTQTVRISDENDAVTFVKTDS